MKCLLFPILNEHLSVNLLMLRVAQAQLFKFLFQDRYPSQLSLLHSPSPFPMFYRCFRWLFGRSQRFFDNWSIDPMQHVSGW